MGGLWLCVLKKDGDDWDCEEGMGVKEERERLKERVMAIGLMK